MVWTLALRFSSPLHVLFCVLVCLVSLTQARSAQSPVTLRVGAVLSLTGEHASVGRAQEAALRAWEASVQTRGFSVEVLIADDGSDPERAAARSEAFLAEGVHALLCCAAESALARTRPSIKRAGVPTLTLTPEALKVGGVADDYWFFSVPPGRAAQLSSLLLYERSQGSSTLALLGLEGEIGDAALHAITNSGMRLVAEARYPPDVRVLTPEALWIAAQQPDAVLVWGHREDTHIALSALSERGFEGRVYVRPQIYETAGTLERADLRGAATLTDAISVGSTLARTHPTYEETRRFTSALSATYGANRPTVEGAYAWDALSLLQRAFEQMLTYTPDVQTDLSRTRQALRDSLVGLEPVTGAAAVYDYLETDHSGVQPGSLVVAAIARGRLVAEP